MRGCIRQFIPTSGSDESLTSRNKVMANMESPCNQKWGAAWNYQNAYNMAVRMELRRRGLPVAPVSGTPRRRTP